jgi:hypothetical protein
VNAPCYGFPTVITTNLHDPHRPKAPRLHDEETDMTTSRHHAAPLRSRRRSNADRIVAAGLATATCVGIVGVLGARTIQDGNTASAAALSTKAGNATLAVSSTGLTQAQLDAYAAQLQQQGQQLDAYRAKLAKTAARLTTAAATATTSAASSTAGSSTTSGTATVKHTPKVHVPKPVAKPAPKPVAKPAPAPRPAPQTTTKSS